MIEINLLPEELRKKEAFKLPKLPIIPIAISVIGVLILLQLLLLFLIQARKTALNSLNNKFSSIALSAIEAEALKNKMDNLSGKVKMMETLNASRFIWSKKLNEISNSMVSGIWLRSLYIEKEKMEGMAVPTTMSSVPIGGTEGAGMLGATPPKAAATKVFLILEGSALVEEGKEPGTVGKFVSAIKGNKSFFDDFDEIELRGVERRTVGQSLHTEVIDFKISCRFKEGRGP